VNKAVGSHAHIYAIALGSNRPLSRSLTPEIILRLAVKRLSAPPFSLRAVAPVISSRPVGPSRRRYANGAALVATDLPPLAMLDALQAIESAFGRKRARRWGERTLDIDIIFWSGGVFRSGRRLCIPHASWAGRSFVTAPLLRIIPFWRAPMQGRHVMAQHRRLMRPKPVDHHPPRI
jgi:2-amino-4-hydroxy-6-hydroxymethyldihydropteridine diphosphokinase